MKRFIFFILSIVVISASSFASEQKKDCGGDKEQFRKELREFKYKFLAQEMQLSKDQQKKFFEVYAAMSNEKRKVHGAVGRMHKALEKDKQLADAEYTKLYEAVTAEKIADGQIEKKYDEKFKTFLSPQQMCKMKMAEIKFHNRLMKMGKKDFKEKKKSEK